MVGEKIKQRFSKTESLDASSKPNLNHIQSFYVVAKHGSLGAAARAGGGSLATLGRHINALEKELNVILFDRRGNGYFLTQNGAQLFDYANEVEIAGARFVVAANARDDSVSGTVSISASLNVANFILPKILSKMNKKLPKISINVIATSDTTNLLLREADIAIRMFRPTQATLIAKKVGDVSLGGYASNDYLTNRGFPQTIGDLANHDMIGIGDDDHVSDKLKEIGINIGPDFYKYRCNDPIVCWSMVVAGCGISLCQNYYAATEERVKRVLPTLEIKLPVWLVSHAELKTDGRVRSVFDFLSSEMGKLQ